MYISDMSAQLARGGMKLRIHRHGKVQFPVFESCSLCEKLHACAAPHLSLYEVPSIDRYLPLPGAAPNINQVPVGLWWPAYEGEHAHEGESHAFAMQVNIVAKMASA